MENVPNSLTAENGYFQKEIIDLFNGIGYSLNTGVLNAADYGVLQNRRRAVIIGKRDGKAPALPLKTEQRVTILDAIGDLAYLESGEGQEEQQYADLPASDCLQTNLLKHSRTKNNVQFCSATTRLMAYSCALILTNQTMSSARMLTAMPGTIPKSI